VLGHLDRNYLETEQEKILHFCGKLSVPRQFLPTKRYTGAIHKKATERYFVDKFPMFFRPASAVVNFTFIDPGWQNFASFENHLFAYNSLFGALQHLHLTYEATRSARFEAARKMFLSMVDRPPKVDPGDEVLRYFRLRKAWELKKYVLFSNDDIALLKQFTQRFANHPCQERYAAWMNGEISDELVRSQFHDLAPQRAVTFETELVDGQGALFETKPKRKTHSEIETTARTRPNHTFSSPFSPVFAGEQKEVSEE